MDIYNQVNLESTELEWKKDIDALDKLLALKQPTAFRYAALMSGHSIVMTPASSLICYGQGPSGIPAFEVDEFTLVSIETHRSALAWIRNDELKHQGWIEQKFGGTFEKAPDSIALAYLLNSLVLARLERTGRAGDPAKPVATYLNELKTKLLERGEKIGAAAALN